MERVAFLIEDTNERIGCLLNPESIAVRRVAGIRPRRSTSGQLTGAGLTDDPLIYTGGGRTELELDLLFDVALAGSTITSEDVRDLTGPLWNLAENIARTDDYWKPRIVRFVWGKAWNMPGVVAVISELLEQFTTEGIPQRSWLRMRLLRVAETVTQQTALPEPEQTLIVSPEELAASVTDEELPTHEFMEGERLDEIAYEYYGDSSLWRLIAAYNGITDPAQVASGTLLRIPALTTGRTA